MSAQISRLLDLNDVALGAYDTGGFAASPGFARFNGRAFEYGLEAQNVARRFPREISTRYWSQLNLQPLTPGLGPARHSADLVHGHLTQLMGTSEDRWALAVPGHFNRDQLSLLLGILETLPGSVGALIHRSVAVAGRIEADALHVEVQLNQLNLTPLRRDDETVIAGDTTVIPGQGWLTLQDKIANLVASRFVEQTRFDPSRSAASEQVLYDAVPKLLEALSHHTEAKVVIDGYTSRIQRSDLAPVVNAYRDEIFCHIDEQCQSMVLDPLIARLPGLCDDRAAWYQQPENWHATILRRLSDLSHTSDGLRVIRRLASSPTVSAPERVYSADKLSMGEPTPSHYLTRGFARPLQGLTHLPSGINITLTENGPALQATGIVGLTVNGEPHAANRVLKIGDQIEVGSEPVAELILVER